VDADSEQKQEVGLEAAGMVDNGPLVPLPDASRMVRKRYESPDAYPYMAVPDSF
jgi:hypothetical protein